MKINQSKNSLKSKKGITLIALVITIIVLLILAGVSISLVVGNNGVLTQASNAVVESRRAEAREDVAMAWASAEADYWSEWTKDSSKVKDLIYYQGKIPGYLNKTGEYVSLDDGEQVGTYEVKYKKFGNEYTFIVDANGNVSFKGAVASSGENGTGGTTGGSTGGSGDTTYSITYSGLENASLTTANPMSYNVNTDTFTLNNPTKSGYTFTGWTGTDLNQATTTVTISNGSTGNRSYVANWEIQSYSIAYSGLENASLTTENPTTYNVNTDSFTLNNPTKSGYTFTGWTGTGLSQATTSVTIAVGSTGNKNYEANWTLNGTSALANSSYVGYYIKKGNEYAIIYVDLLGKTTYTGGALQGSTSSVSVPSSVTSGKTFKTYVVTDTKYTDPNGKFGTNNVIEVSNSTGEDRFIAMALSDKDSNKHSWWIWFYSNSSSLGTSYEIGSGKTNTETVKTAWDNAGTSKQNTNDIWSLITLNSGSADWFIPSNNEWIAFGAMSWTDSASTPVARTITSSNYSTDRGLKSYYCSSSQSTSIKHGAQHARFSSGDMAIGSALDTSWVRLSTTF